MSTPQASKYRPPLHTPPTFLGNADFWNTLYPEGTRVRYWPVMPPMDGIPPVESRTRSIAWNLGNGAPVVKVEGRTGGLLLSHLEVLDEP